MSGESAVARVAAALEAAHATHDTVNAFISLDDDRALRRARELDERAAAGDDIGPLGGMPIGMKDLIEHEGRVTTAGSSFYAEVATETAPVIRRLEEAGAVVIGRTNLHEWAFGFNSENAHWGPVRNPWDLNTSAGGSSGGSGAAVAAGITPMSVGTDTGGSVRVPAALCGTYGLKVTHGRIPLDGVFPLVPSVDTVGPIADSMDTLETSYRVMAADDASLPTVGSRRLGVPEPWYGDAAIEDGVRDSFEGTVAALRGLGHEVHPIQMPDVKPSRHLIAAIAEVAEVHRRFREEGRHYDPAVEARIVAVEEVTAEELAEAREWQAMIRARFHDAFETVDLLLTPTIPARKKIIGEDEIDGRNHRSVLSYFTAVVNHALLPALAAPIANSGAPPSSIQVIGPAGSELLLIAFGRQVGQGGITRFTTARPNSATAGDG